MKSFLQAWTLQNRVIAALLLREMQLRWGRRNLGFAWVFVEPLAFAIPVLVMWSLLRSPEHGVPLIPFLWSGYLPLLMFRHMTGHAIYTIKTNASLLYHRGVTPLDLLTARCGLEAIGNLAATVVSFFVFHLLGELDWPQDPALFMLGTLYMMWWSVAVALIVGAWSERSELVEHIWMPISYMYLPISGFFFLADWLPTPIRNVALTVMPSLHSYEMIRGGLFGNQIQVYFDLPYVSCILAALTLFGLWLVRDVRRYLEFD